MRRLQPLRQQYETLKTELNTAPRRLETIRDSLKHSADFAIDDTPMEHAPSLANIEDPLGGTCCPSRCNGDFKRL